MKKSILLICYEYEGFHSKQTTALVKRPKYVAEYLASKGYQITVLFSYKRTIQEHRLLADGAKLKLEGIPYRFKPVLKNRWIQKIRTAYFAFTKGDFSSSWSEMAMDRLKNEKVKFDAVLCFFTPRGPLYLGYLVSKRYKVPLFFDFQDPMYEGFYSSLGRVPLNYFYKRIAKQKPVVSCVSKEWGRELEEFFGQVNHIPHAIENKIKAEDKTDPNKLVIFYYGSIDFNFQNIDALLVFLSWATIHVPNTDIEFKFAGSKETYHELESRLSVLIPVIYLGWLDKESLFEEVSSSDILCLLSWEVNERKGIPSKFYEYCRFDKPILILGKDAGGFEQEFGEPFVHNYIDLKWSSAFKEKKDLVNRLFRPNEKFLEEYSVERIGEQFERLVEP
ncbi:hypothetical protein [Algoriphagus sp.]|uniref:hypothetical protein n=1 Tax=Algoriphagus sp. TaxID=1872435 RepID=UPI0026294D9D|nr:hypothetical protein [Algoriphagus sp.]